MNQLEIIISKVDMKKNVRMLQDFYLDFIIFSVAVLSYLTYILIQSAASLKTKSMITFYRLTYQVLKGLGAFLLQHPHLHRCSKKKNQRE